MNEDYIQYLHYKVVNKNFIGIFSSNLEKFFFGISL